MKIEQYAVYWVDLNPTRGAEINKTRPCVVISPPEMNLYLKTVTVAPITSTGKDYPSRVLIGVGTVTGWVVLDQIRAIDKTRLSDKVGMLSESESTAIKNTMREIFVD